MELLIVVLWYLQLIVPGSTYTYNDIQAIAAANQSDIEAVATNPQERDAAIKYFEETWDSDANLIEWWDFEPKIDPPELPPDPWTIDWKKDSTKTTEKDSTKRK